MSDGDYLLGTRDDEIERLGLQHRVWRDEMLHGFKAAGFGPGLTILDVGSGPGHAARDIADLVGPTGRVIAYERSPHFIDHLRRQSLPNVDVRSVDLMTDDLGDDAADGAWVRWVLAFLPDPAVAVRKIAAALKPGSKTVFHEYLDYEAWRLIPQPEAHRQYRDLVVRSWKDSGGDPDAALSLPSWLEQAGMDILSMRPMAKIITPDDPLWDWPKSFMASNAWRLHELGYCSAIEAGAFATLLDSPPPGARMLTPVVAEVVAVRR